MNTDTDQPERERLARRATIRAKVAQATMTEDRIGLQTAELDRIDGEVETATDLHLSLCTPLQRELEALEEKAV